MAIFVGLDVHRAQITYDVFDTETGEDSEIGAAHAKSVAQVVLRWLIQRDVIVIPKSVRPERMRETSTCSTSSSPATRWPASPPWTRRDAVFDHADPEWVSRLNSVRIAYRFGRGKQ